MSYEHTLDRRSTLLASKIKHRIDVLAEMLRPRGGMAPFTEQLTNEDALVFWRRHRFDQIGEKIIAGWTPTQVLQLDQWLASNPDPALHRGEELL